jgi:hypothetical protein
VKSSICAALAGSLANFLVKQYGDAQREITPLNSGLIFPEPPFLDFLTLADLCHAPALETHALDTVRDRARSGG